MLLFPGTRMHFPHRCRGGVTFLSPPEYWETNPRLGSGLLEHRDDGTSAAVLYVPRDQFTREDAGEEDGNQAPPVALK